jgi:RecA/RadA recombinase
MGKLVSFAKAAKKKYGGVVGRADTTPTDDRRLPSGSIRLDYGLGGGYRVGWITSLYGEKSGGKTTTAIRALTIAQNYCRNCLRPVSDVVAVPPSKDELKEDPEARWSAEGTCDCYATGLYRPEDPPKKDSKEKEKDYKERVAKWRAKLKKNSYEEFVCAWIDPEGTFAKDYAASIGLDNRRVMYVRPESAEEGIDIMHALICTVEVDMMAVDSIAQLVPLLELSASTEEWQQGLQARLVNKAVRKLVSGSSMVARNRRSITQIWINQTREKIGKLFGDPTVKPGGKGQEFAVCAEIKFGKNTIESVEEQYGSEKEKLIIPVKETFNFTVTKNKTQGTSTVTGFYSQSMRDSAAGPKGRIMEEDDVFKLTMHYLVEEQKGKGKYVLAGKEYPTQKAIMADLRDDKDLLVATKKVLLEKMLGSQG